jgi:hypothetical protein
MAEARRFCVVVFSRNETNRVRTDGVIRASSEPQALWLASHFAGDDEGAVVLSQSQSVSLDNAGSIRVLDQFGAAIPFGSNISEVLKRALGARDLSITLAGTRSTVGPAGAKQVPTRRLAARRRRHCRS